MTNPNNAIGTNAAYGSRTSVDAFNDLAQTLNGRGIVSGWKCVPQGGMVVELGGQAGIRDVAIAEDNLGNYNIINNRSGSPVSISIAAASVSAARYSAIVAYINKPAQANNETPDAPSACGIIEVQGNASGVSEAQIRSAISADGGTGSVAYYVVLATIYVDVGATVITNANITSGKVSVAGGIVGADSITDGSVSSSKIDWTTLNSYRRLDLGVWHFLAYSFSNSSAGWFAKEFAVPEDLDGRNVQALIISQSFGYSGNNYGNVLYGREKSRFFARMYQGTSGSNGGIVIAVFLDEDGF